jgi:hypothetical protein
MNGFLIFTQGDAELSSGDIEGTVAMGAVISSSPGPSVEPPP